jgi:choline monooxygenase
MATAPGNPPRPIPAEAFGLEKTYRATRLPVDYASTLIPDAYTSEEFRALEEERVFGTAWVPVCVTDEVAEPGSFVVVEVAGRSVIVCRSRDGALRAHHNVCRHRGAQLVTEPSGSVKRFFQCPYHAWAYDLDGACLGTPLFTPEAGIPEDQQGIFDMSEVKEFDKADHGLYPVRAEEWGCLVFVCLDPMAPALADELGDLPQRLAGYRLGEQRLVRRVEYEIEANWKLVAENFTEYYHLPWVHPALVKVSPMSAHYRWQGPGMYVGFCTTPIAANTDDGGWQGMPPMTGLSETDAVSARFAWVFPSVAINALPNHTFLMLTRPTAAGHTSEVTYLLVPPETQAALDGDGERAVDELLVFWDEVNREDIEIVERVQRGLANLAYTGGRMCYRFEESVHRFQNMVIDRMVGVRRVPEGDAEEQRPLVSPSA